MSRNSLRTWLKPSALAPKKSCSEMTRMVSPIRRRAFTTRFDLECLEDRLTPAFGTPLLNFDGIAFTGALPPDPNGDIGQNHYIQATNNGGGDSLMTVYDKNTGAPVAGFIDKPVNTLVPNGPADGLGDPVVQYDNLANRWLILELADDFASVNIFLSATADPTGSWSFYNFSSANLPDYPKIGVAQDAYYIGTNEPDDPVYALDRPLMLAGNGGTLSPIRLTTPARPNWQRHQIMPADQGGATPPPVNSQGWFVRQVDDEYTAPGSNDVANDFLEIWQFRPNFVTPASSTYTLTTTIPIADFDYILADEFGRGDIEQPGTGELLDSLPHYMMWHVQYRNFGTHETMVGCFTADVNEDATPDGSGGSAAEVAGVRWFEIRKVGVGNWTLYQEGTVPFADMNHRWMGTIAMNGAGDMALGYSVSSTTVNPSLRYIGRKASDPLGTMPDGEHVLINGGGYVNAGQRWGDYQSMGVDPVDDSTFWFNGMYGTASHVWQTRVGKMPGLDSPPTISNIPNQLILRNSTTGALAFTVNDVETPPANLIVTATSSNTVLVPNANVVLGGFGINRTVTVTPVANMSGVTTITVTVQDEAGGTAFDTFTVTVNDPPQISNITDRTIAEDSTTGPIAFTVSDIETAAGSLTLTRGSSNLALVPLANIVFGGSGANRTVTVTPAPNQSGTATITVNVSDGLYTVPDTFVLTVGAANDPPTVTVGASPSTQEDTPVFVTGISIGDIDAGGGNVSLTLSAVRGILTVSTSVPGGVNAGNITNNGSASVTILSTLARINTTLGSATGLTYLPNLNFSGTDTITALVNDNGNTGSGGPLSASRNLAVNVGALADPPIVTVSNTSATEATTAPLDITVTLADTDGSEILTSIIVSGVPAFGSLSAGINNNDGTWRLTQGQLAGLTYSPADDGTITLTVTATSRELSNTSTASTAQGLQVDVTPVGPTMGLTAPTTGVRGQRIPFTVQPTDPSPVDQAAYFTFNIDWDANGTIDEIVQALAGSIIPHAFPTTGAFTSRFTVTDADGLTSPSFDHTINLSVFQIQPDPIDSTKTALVVGGTINHDKISFKPGPTAGSVIPVINGVKQGSFTPTGRIIAFGQSGNDKIKADPTMKLPVWFDGGLGEDQLTGGRMNDILQGQGGNDVVNGGDGRDLVFGGAGLDSLTGGNHDDLMVAALTGFDTNDKALAAIHLEWISNKSYTERVQNLSGLQTQDESNILLPVITVADDSQVDNLSGQSGQDWFFADLIVGKDKIGDAALNEVITS